jgi:hypothetical protein
MNFLFFTRSNGDIDNMPNREEHDTEAKRIAFIGDDGASNFQVIASDSIPKKPKWDGEKYVSDTVKINAEAAQVALKQLIAGRDSVAYAPVEHLGLTWEYNSLFENAGNRSKSRQWISKNDKVKNLSAQDCKAIADLFDDQVQAAFDKFIIDAGLEVIS